MPVTDACFGLSYLVAFLMELVQQVRPGRTTKIIGVLFGGAGLIAHTLYLLLAQPSPAAPRGSLLLLAWVLAIFYLYETVHPKRQPWALFVLPLVLVLVGLSFAFKGESVASDKYSWFAGDHFWGMVHGTLVLLACVGITLGFLASVMYLVQTYRLRRKLNPIGGMKLFSLERLETINRRGINVAFPLLTVGLLLGAMRVNFSTNTEAGWTDLKIVSTVGLWVAALLLMYLRYGIHLPGRRLSLLTIVAFGLMLVTLFAAHPLASGEPR
jgi:ABC-type transport system involved in cytochrome c biogenesis permease subunit